MLGHSILAWTISSFTKRLWRLIELDHLKLIYCDHIWSMFGQYYPSMFNCLGNLGPCLAMFWVFVLYFYFFQSEINQIFTNNSFKAIRPYDNLLNCHIYMLSGSGTPLQFHCGHLGTAVDLWSCCTTISFFQLYMRLGLN